MDIVEFSWRSIEEGVRVRIVLKDMLRFEYKVKFLVGV